jgi:hypothetical protein
VWLPSASAKAKEGGAANLERPDDDPVKDGTPPVVVAFPDDGENLRTRQEIRRRKKNIAELGRARGNNTRLGMGAR